MEATTNTLQRKLADWVEDAHAMEQRMRRELDVMVAALEQESRWPAVQDVGGDDLLQDFKRHREETDRHERRLRERLDALGRTPSPLKQAKSVIVGTTASFVESAGKDKSARHGRDAFAAEHMEIAAYELLERLARRVGDTETAEVARSNRVDEEQMAGRLADRWDLILDLTIAPEAQ